MGIRTFKAAVFLKIRMKSECFGERIATPVCAPARNDSFFDSLKRPVFEPDVFLFEKRLRGIRQFFGRAAARSRKHVPKMNKNLVDNLKISQIYCLVKHKLTSFLLK